MLSYLLSVSPSSTEPGPFWALVHGLPHLDSKASLGSNLPLSVPAPSETGNLEQLVEGGLSSLDKSHVSYDGSLSEPGCQPVKRIVMLSVLPVSTESLQSLRESMLNGVTANARDIQNVANGVQ